MEKGNFLLVIDDFNRYVWIEFLRIKGETLRFIKKIKLAEEVGSECRLFAVRTDCGGEFISDALEEFCEDTKVNQNTTASYLPQPNGVVEMQNKTMLELTRCLMKSIETHELIMKMQ